MPDTARQALLERLPDQPRWVETRGMLLGGECELLGSLKPGCAVRSKRDRLVGVVGDPGQDVLAAATTGAGPGWTVVAPPETARRVATRLPGWRHEDAVLHTLPPLLEPTAARVDAELRPIGPDSVPDLDHLPPELREEIAAAAGRVPMVAAFADGLPVSFCYAWLESETLWDVSVDTLAQHRRRGLAGACAAALVRRMRRHGKQPVWAAVESNRASLALAWKLDFRPVDRLAVFTPSGPTS